MLPSYDFLIVGSGLTGATIARLLTDRGRSVLVVERRSHVGGNVHDYAHESGVRIHTYGPHYFRTSSDRMWAYVNRFTEFFKYEACLKSLVDGKLECWPITGEYIQRTVGADWKPAFQNIPSNFEEASLSMMPHQVYEKFVKGYSEKQWGVPAATLSADLAGRFDVRPDNEQRLKLSTYQGIPTHGYAHFMSQMLAGIPVLINCNYLTCRSEFNPRLMIIFTGPIDEYFDFSLGKLSYRGQRREHTYHPDVDYLQPCGQVNNPSPHTGAHIRTLEWKHMMPQAFASRIKGTVLTTETTISPSAAEDYEYPMPDAANRAMYKRYRELACESPGLFICGRLGEYRYFDMDQAIGRAFRIVDQLTSAGLVDNAAQGVKENVAIIKKIEEGLSDDRVQHVAQTQFAGAAATSRNA